MDNANEAKRDALSTNIYFVISCIIRRNGMQIAEKRIRKRFRRLVILGNDDGQSI